MVKNEMNNIGFQRKSKAKKILYFYIRPMSFVVKDIRILKEHYEVVEYQLDTKIKWRIPFKLVRQLIFILNEITTSQVIISFFAGYHSLIPAILAKVFRKPMVIFLGGADAYRYPTFNYGHFNKFLIGKFTCLSCRMADLLVPVDDCLIFSESEYFSPEYSKQGIHFFCKKLTTPHETIRLEYDHNLFYKKTVNTFEKTFITAAFGISGSSFVRKGIDLLIEVAKLLPDCKFTVLGCTARDIKVPFTSNVQFLPPVLYEQLPNIYSQHQFYLQLSIAEGFPSAICEAMLCECVPIGSNVAAIPDIVGDAGFILSKRDVNELNDLIRNALQRDDLSNLGKRARERIMQNFYMGSRSRRLNQILETLIAQK